MAETLKHSDIVLSWGGLDPDTCRKYGVSVWGWGPYYDVKQVMEAYGLGIRMVASLVNLNIREPHTTEVGRDLFYNPQLSASTCRDITGEPVVVSWWAREYGDNNRAYWHCTNHPLYREHLKRVARSGILAGGNALHIDDAMSNAMVVRLRETGGCFCDHCMEKFRKHLDSRHSQSELAAMGIENIATFDYRELVRQTAPTRAAFGDAYAAGKVPLQGAFHLFLTIESANFLGELVRCAKETAGADIPVSANLGTMRPEYLLGARHPDHFVIELKFWRPSGDFPLIPLKIAQSLGKKCATWPVGPDVDRVRRNNSTGMLQLWISTCYALGHNFMIPAHMWCSTSANDMVWFDAPDAEFLPLYGFIRENAGLFDGFEEEPAYSLLYSNADMIRGRAALEETAWDLFDGNIPFQLVLAGDNYCDHYLHSGSADGYRRMIIPDAETIASLDPGQRALVEQWLADGRAVIWSRKQAAELTPSVRAPGTWTTLRRKAAPESTEWSVHVINKHYDPQSNSFGPPRKLRIEIDRSRFGEDLPQRALLHGPESEPSEVELTADGDWIRADIILTGCWKILSLRVPVED